jgi:hypothetical protein
MSSEQKVLAIVMALLVVGLVAVLYVPSLVQGEGPVLKAAWVGIEVEGSGVAVVGPVEVTAGTPFTLRAVLEAEVDGETVYFTEAPALTFGDDPVPAEQIRKWKDPRPVKVLWSTVEGYRPYLALEPGEGVWERFHLTEFLRSDWPYVWSVRGHLEPDFDDPLASPDAQVERPFGTQRYQVRIEIYKDEVELVPQQRLISWGADQLPERVDEFPTVVAALPGPAGPASTVFGLTHLAAPPDADEAVTRGLVEATRQRLAFATLPVVRLVLDAAGADADDLRWNYVELGGEARWGEDVHPGDLLRAGGRVVVLYADAAPGQAAVARPAPGDGVLDGDDLCFDFVRGAVVRPLSEVFEAEGGQVERLDLGGAGAAP